MTLERTAAAESRAQARAVWDLLLDGRRWALWNEGVEWMWFEGDAAPGTVVTVKLRRMRQTALLVDEIVIPKRLALSVTFGPAAIMRVIWTLHEVAHGTRIESEVLLDGFAAALFRKRVERLAAVMPGFLTRLAARADGDRVNAPVEGS